MESLSVTAVKYWCWWAAGDHEWFLFAQQKGENEGKKVLKDFFHSSREHQETTKSTRTWNFFRLIRGDQIRTGFFFFIFSSSKSSTSASLHWGKNPTIFFFATATEPASGQWARIYILDWLLLWVTSALSPLSPVLLMVLQQTKLFQPLKNNLRTEIWPLAVDIWKDTYVWICSLWLKVICVSQFHMHDCQK